MVSSPMRDDICARLMGAFFMELTNAQAVILLRELKVHMDRLNRARLQRAREDKAFQRFLQLALHRFA